MAALQMSDAAMETRMCSGGKKYDPDAPLPLEFFARRVLAPAVLHPIGKAVVLLVGVALTAVAAWQVWALLGRHRDVAHSRGSNDLRRGSTVLRSRCSK